VPQKFGRNDPCWCGSGRKYKRCHLNRETQAPRKFWEVDRQLRQAFSHKTCLVPDGWSKACVGRPIRAHTIPRSTSLRRIARDGHVYGFVPTFEKLSQYNGRVPPELIGVNRASTFTGFCATHDAELFRPLEKESFKGSPEQCFLLSYRALAREIYTKIASMSLSGLRSESDKGRDRNAQLSVQRMNFFFNMGVAAGIRDNEHHKKLHDALLQERNFQSVSAYIIELEEPPTVMCSAGLFPERTFDGRVLQDISALDEHAQLLGLSAFADESGGYVVLSWLPNSDLVCRPFVEGLASIPDEKLSAGLLRLMFEYCENVFIQPEWWESLTAPQRTALINRMANLVDQFETGKPSGDISDDGVTYTPWRVRARRQIPITLTAA